MKHLKTPSVALFFSLFICSFLLNFKMAAQGIYQLPKKKVIEFAMNAPTPTYIINNIQSMEKLPFDGVIFELPQSVVGGNVFDVKGWQKVSKEALEKQLDTMRMMPTSSKLTDNFLAIFGASSMDWFSDSDWKLVIEQIRYCAKAAKIAKIKGICWDAEPYYSYSPWLVKVQPDAASRSYAQYYDKVRQRGKEFVEAIQAEFSEAVIFSLRQLSDLSSKASFATHYNLLAAKDNKSKQDTLPFIHWSLVVPFTNGLLDAILPEAKCIDANEDAYYYTSAEDFYYSSHVIKKEALCLVAPENRVKYQSQVSLGHAVAFDWYLGYWVEAFDKFGFSPVQSRMGLVMTDAERLKYLQHNLYYALKSSDEYVWIWSEEMSLWENKNVPSGFIDAITVAKNKYENGEPLGYSITSLINNSQQKAKQLLKKKKK